MSWGVIRRATTVAVAGVTAVLVGAAPALAVEPVSGVATMSEEVFAYAKVTGLPDPVRVSERHLEIAGKDRLAYSVDLHTAMPHAGVYTEATWAQSAVETGQQQGDLGKVQGVLLNGFRPAVSGPQLAKAAGLDPAVLGDDERLHELAYVATQLAVWHFSDKAVFTDAVIGVQPGQVSTRENLFIRTMYKYLTDKAVDAPEPSTDLTVTPAAAAAAAGAMAGPFTVRGPGGAIALSVQGGTAVDAAGKPVTTVANGASFYVTRDSAGEVSVGVKSDLKLSVGRIFLYNAKGDSAYGGEAEDAAKLVLAEGVPGALAATAKATFTVAPTGQAPSPGAGTPPAGGSGGGELPVTGASTTLAAGVGVLLLVAGGAAVYLVRRRRVKFTA